MRKFFTKINLTKSLLRGIFFITSLILFSFSTEARLTLEDVRHTMSQPHDSGLIAQNLRAQLGRENISRQEATAVVIAFKNNRPWENLIPAGLVKGIKPPVSPKPPAFTYRPLNPSEQWIKRTLKKKREYKKSATEEYEKAEKDFFPNTQNTGIRGDLTVEKLREWLERSGLINRTFFDHPNCLTIKEGGHPGASTQKLFLVRNNPLCPQAGPQKLVFIIKELSSDPEKAGTEMSNLSILQKSPALRELGKFKDPSLPQLTFTEDFYWYENWKGESSYLTLIHAARGTSLIDLYEEDPQGPKTLKAFEKLGEVLANFHKRFLTGKNCLLKGGQDINQCFTVSHGDLHPVNVFFDGKFIYFIDTETMNHSLEARTPLLKDAAYLFLLPTCYWGEGNKYKPAYRVFMNSYINHLTDNPVFREKIQAALADKVNQEKTRYTKT
ncbi:MAG: hypothetical protein A2977_01460 [Alphaproteobacteria bacterium RIFCSPLOWO2_01_FULL_45_8]|nr:MAG: hypothetical protein A2977_01460 [Alphaproteobacteria bacterium RIFCSPLOWO2_01_FULL_45_8]